VALVVSLFGCLFDVVGWSPGNSRRIACRGYIPGELVDSFYVYMCTVRKSQKMHRSTTTAVFDTPPGVMGECVYMRVCVCVSDRQN